MLFVSILTQFLGAGGRRFKSCCSDHFICKKNLIAEKSVLYNTHNETATAGYVLYPAALFYSTAILFRHHLRIAA